jgi:hypothetical protein
MLAQSPGERCPALERSARAGDPLNLIRLTPAEEEEFPLG